MKRRLPRYSPQYVRNQARNAAEIGLGHRLSKFAPVEGHEGRVWFSTCRDCEEMTFVDAAPKGGLFIALPERACPARRRRNQ